MRAGMNKKPTDGPFHITWFALGFKKNENIIIPPPCVIFDALSVSLYDSNNDVYAFTFNLCRQYLMIRENITDLIIKSLHPWNENI